MMSELFKRTSHHYTTMLVKVFDEFWCHICATGFHIFFIYLAFFIDRNDLIALSLFTWFVTNMIFTVVHTNRRGGLGFTGSLFSDLAMKKFANIIEAAFLPPFVIAYGGILFIMLELKAAYRTGEFGVLLCDTFGLLSAIGVAAAAYIGTWLMLNFDRNTRHQHLSTRGLSFSAGAIAGCAIFGFLSLFLNTSLTLKFASLALVIFVFLGQIIRLYWNLSAHMLTSGFVITALSMVNPWFIGAFVILPVIAWSRIKLGCHTFLQIVAGTLFGAGVPLVGYQIIKYLGIVSTLGLVI